MATNMHGKQPDGATAANVNPVVMAGKDAAGNVDAWKVESGVGSVADATLSTKIGEVQVSPTANTLLARIKAIETALAGTLTTSVTGSRGAVTTHRSAVTAADKVATVTLATIAKQDATVGVMAAVSHGAGVAPGNAYGSSGISNLLTITPTVNKTVDLTIPQAAGATYYDIFFSAAPTAPLWLARITEAQRAAGCAITAVATVGAGGSAGVVNIQLVGTEIASTAAPFAANNAYIPENATAIPCGSKVKAYIHCTMTLTDLRSLPSFGIIPFFQNNDSESSAWFQADAQSLSVMGGATGRSLYQVLEVDVNAVRNMIVLVDSISGQGASIDISVEFM